MEHGRIYTIKEIAEVLGISLQRVSKIEEKAKRKFKKNWIEMFPDIPNPMHRDGLQKILNRFHDNRK